MSSQVKKFYARGLDCLWRDPEGAPRTLIPLVLASDYADLEAECEVHRNTAAGAHQQLTENRLETERLAKDWMSAVAERDALRAELAITRRVIHRIGQLCTTPHESKERFIRRVQSVIEWQAAAQQDQPK